MHGTLSFTKRRLLPRHADLAMPRARLISALLCLALAGPLAANAGAGGALVAVNEPRPPRRRRLPAPLAAPAPVRADRLPGPLRHRRQRRRQAGGAGTGGDRIRSRRPSQTPAGLPTCPAERIATVGTAEARRLCAGAIVGSGSIEALVRPRRERRRGQLAAGPLQRPAPGRQPDRGPPRPPSPRRQARLSRSSCRSNGARGRSATAPPSIYPRSPAGSEPSPASRSRSAAVSAPADGAAATSPPAAPTGSCGPMAASPLPTARSSKAASKRAVPLASRGPAAAGLSSAPGFLYFPAPGR